MPPIRIILLIALTPLASENRLLAGIYSVSAAHICSAYNGIDGDSVNFTAPASPFSNAHTIQFGDWRCSSQHSGSFDAQQGTYSMTDSLQARDVGDYTFALSAGSFGFRTDVDALVSYEGAMNYSLPGNLSEASLTFTADRYDFPSGQNTTIWSDFDGLDAIDPVSGTAQISGSFILRALQTDSIYFLSFGMNLYTSGDSNVTGNLLTADGTMEVSFSAVPEPVTLTWMLISFGFLRGRVRAREAS